MTRLYMKQYIKYLSLADKLNMSFNNDKSALTTAEFLKTLQKMKWIAKINGSVRTMINYASEDVAMLIVRKAVDISISDYQGRTNQFVSEFRALSQYLADFVALGLEFDQSSIKEQLASIEKAVPKELVADVLDKMNPENKQTKPRKTDISQKVHASMKKNGWGKPSSKTFEK